jgi:hypothetical protein
LPVFPGCHRFDQGSNPGPYPLGSTVLYSHGSGAPNRNPRSVALAGNLCSYEMERLDFQALDHARQPSSDAANGVRVGLDARGQHGLAAVLRARYGVARNDGEQANKARLHAVHLVVEPRNGLVLLL